MSVQGSPIAELALRLKLPSIYADPLFAKAGGLMSYGARTLIAYSRISLPTSIRFSSAKPADLPVEQPSKFELIINLKTAKALGLDIPPNLLVLADEGDRKAESNVWLWGTRRTWLLKLMMSVHWVKARHCVASIEI